MEGESEQTTTTMPKEKDCDRSDIPRVWENVRARVHNRTHTHAHTEWASNYVNRFAKSNSTSEMRLPAKMWKRISDTRLCFFFIDDDVLWLPSLLLLLLLLFSLLFCMQKIRFFIFNNNKKYIVLFVTISLCVWLHGTWQICMQQIQLGIPIMCTTPCVFVCVWVKDR